MFGFKNRNEDREDSKGRVKLEGCLVETEDNLCKEHGYRKDSCYFCLTGKKPNEPEPETRDPFSSSSFKNI